MNYLGSSKQNHRMVVWAIVGVLALIAASSPWFATVVYACQNTGGGC